MQDTSVHGQTMSFEESGKRKVTVAWIWASAFACPVPDEVSGCHAQRK
jgi:hypothetical protein